jgi:hypothetical protein
MKSRERWSAILAVLAAVACAASADARGLTLGFTDYEPFEGAENPVWYGRAHALGAGIVRLTARWSEIAPAARAGLGDARDPAETAYRWQRLDTAVRGAAEHGLQVLVTVHSAPPWAEGPGRPSGARPGTWRPQPSAFAEFMEAAARRYSGTFPDPDRPGAALPRVRYWQPWNEPNLPTYMTPQWTGRRLGARPASPAWYRRMLNGAYARLKAVHADNYVVAAGTAPYGDPPQVINRMTPVRFMRELLCLRGASLERTRCTGPAHFDAIDHHPYAVGSPTQHALLAENVAIPDLGKLTRIVRAARRARTVRPAGAKGVWVTELSWDSRPPDPDGVPESRRARWLQDAFHSLWRQGVSTICWFLLRDQPPTPSYHRTYQSGLYFIDGRSKRSAAAFRFPLVVWRAGRRVRVWGRSPASGPVTIERRRGGRWSAIATLHARSGAVFRARVAAPAGAVLRARAGPVVTLSRSAG